MIMNSGVSKKSVSGETIYFVTSDFVVYLLDKNFEDMDEKIFIPIFHTIVQYK